MQEEAGRLLERVRESSPLVHNITNVVVTNFTANGLYAIGASPVMAYSKKEVADMVKIAGALVLNIGTLDEPVVEAMLLAGKAANAHGVPVIFDPVGAGATPYRTETAQMIAKEIKLTVIRGNAAEIANIIGEQWLIKGVDGAGDTGKQDRLHLAEKAAKTLDTVIAMTGATDLVTDGVRTYEILNGHPMLTKVTGTGCLLSSVVAAFTAVEKDPVKAAVAAITAYGVAGEVAFERAGEKGPGSFQIEFLNQLSKVSAHDVMRLGKIEKR